jgi:hypothetical protein
MEDKMVKLLVFLLIILVVLPCFAQAATWEAASCSQSDVNKAIGSARDGDTVTIPDGSCAWSSGVSTTKQIIIGAKNYSPIALGRGTQSVIITNNSSAPLFTFTSGNSYHCGLYGIRFNEGTGTGNHARFNGSGSKVPLVNDCYWELKDRFGSASDVAAFAFLSQGGVMWNCKAVGKGATGATGQNIYVSSPRAWDTASTMGSLDTNGTINMYVEDSTFLNAGWHTTPDCDQSGRFVMRHCIIDGTSGGTHGYTSHPGEGRAVEFYNNTYRVTTANRNLSGRYFWMRAGTGVFTDNAVDCGNQGYGNNAQLVTIWEGTGAYPQAHQTGWGHNGTTNVIEPIYVWNNTGTCAYSYANDSPGYVRLNVELFVNNGAKPGFTKYTYPHPLRSGGGGISPPGGLRIIQ